MPKKQNDLTRIRTIPVHIGEDKKMVRGARNCNNNRTPDVICSCELTPSGKIPGDCRGFKAEKGIEKENPDSVTICPSCLSTVIEAFRVRLQDSNLKDQCVTAWTEAQKYCPHYRPEIVNPGK